MTTTTNTFKPNYDYYLSFGMEEVGIVELNPETLTGSIELSCEPNSFYPETLEDAEQLAHFIKVNTYVPLTKQQVLNLRQTTDFWRNDLYTLCDIVQVYGHPSKQGVLILSYEIDALTILEEF